MPRPQSIKISIITVVLNQGHLLQRCINAIAAQKTEEVEYIIIDGGSTDGTLDIIQANQSTIDHWISEQDAGISDAFNKGLNLCKGEWVGIINADDWYTNDALKTILNNATKADVLYGNVQFWKGNSPSYCYEADHQRLLLEMSLNHPAVFIRKACYDEWGGFDLTYRCAMDYELLLRFHQAALRFKHIPQVLANMQDGGISDQNWMLGFQEVKRAKDFHLGKKSAHWWWLQKQTLSVRSIRLLEKLGLQPLLKFYRKHFAPVKKHWHGEKA